MAISPQRLTIYLYSAHRAVIFAIAQLSCLVFASCNFDVTFISDVFCGEISDVIYNVRKLHFCKCHLWYKHNLLT